MTADQSPDLETALRELADKFDGIGIPSRLIRQLLDAHPTPAQTCRICGGENGNHDGASHDARSADIPSPEARAEWWARRNPDAPDHINPFLAPTPAQSSEQEVVALWEEVGRLGRACVGLIADKMAAEKERDDALAEVERLRDRQRDIPVFHCQTHMCGSCGGCKAAGIRDENTALRNQRDDARAEVERLRAERQAIDVQTDLLGSELEEWQGMAAQAREERDEFEHQRDDALARLAAHEAGMTSEQGEHKARGDRAIAVIRSALKGFRDGRDPQWIEDTLAEGSRGMVLGEEWISRADLAAGMTSDAAVEAAAIVICKHRVHYSRDHSVPCAGCRGTASDALTAVATPPEGEATT